MCDIGKRNRSEKQRKGCGDPRWCGLKICGITTVSYFLESTDKDESRLNSGRQRIGKKHDSQNAWSSPRLNIEIARHSRSRLRNTRTRSVQSMSHDSPLCLQEFTTDLFPISSSYLTFYFSSKVDSLSLHTATQTLHSDTQSDHYPQSQHLVPPPVCLPSNQPSLSFSIPQPRCCVLSSPTRQTSSWTTLYWLPSSVSKMARMCEL